MLGLRRRIGAVGRALRRLRRVEHARRGTPGRTREQNPGRGDGVGVDGDRAGAAGGRALRRRRPALADRPRRGRPGARRRADAGIGDPRRRRARHRQVDPAAAAGGVDGRPGLDRALRVGRGVAPSGQAAGRATRRRRPTGCGWPTTRPSTPCSPISTPSEPDVVVVDSIQTMHDPVDRVGARLGRPGAGVRPPPGRRGEGAGDRRGPRRPCHQGRRARRAPAARAHRRHGAVLRGRPPPRPAAAPGGQAPLRIDR